MLIQQRSISILIFFWMQQKISGKLLTKIPRTEINLKQESKALCFLSSWHMCECFGEHVVLKVKMQQFC